MAQQSSVRFKLNGEPEAVVMDGSWWVRQWVVDKYGSVDAAPPEVVEANRVKRRQAAIFDRMANVRAANEDPNRLDWNGQLQRAGFGMTWQKARALANAEAQRRGWSDEDLQTTWAQGPGAWISQGLLGSPGGGAPGPTPTGGGGAGPSGPAAPQQPSPYVTRPYVGGGATETKPVPTSGLPNRPYAGASDIPTSPAATRTTPGGSVPSDTRSVPVAGAQTSTGPTPTPRMPGSSQPVSQGGGAAATTPGAANPPGRPGGAIVPGATASPAASPLAAQAPPAAPATPYMSPSVPQTSGAPTSAVTPGSVYPVATPPPAPPPPPDRPVAIPAFLRSIPGLPQPRIVEGKPFFDPFVGKFV